MNTSPARRRGALDRPGSAWGLPWEPFGDLDDLFDRLGRWTGWLPGTPPRSGQAGRRSVPIGGTTERETITGQATETTDRS